MSNSPPMMPSILTHLKAISDRIGPINQRISVFIAGGAAVNYYTGSRMSMDVDMQWSLRVAIPPDMKIFTVTPEDLEEPPHIVTMDGSFGDYLGSFHPDWKKDAQLIGHAGNIDVHVISPLDLAVSKIARFQDNDRKDIEALADSGYFDAEMLQKRAMEALQYFVGDLTFILYNLNEAIAMIKRIDPDEDQPGQPE